MEKKRLDILLVEKGYFKTREKARKSIMSGAVFINDVNEDKPGMRFRTDVDVRIKENICPYVSRGGLKLEKALDYFKIDLKGKTAIDVGASTGGFTDCMLKKGIGRVIAIDVGYGQFDWALRNDERVVCLERTNIRYVRPEDIKFIADLAVIDVSFISLKKITSAVLGLIKDTGEIIALVKPQFEAGREKVGKGGVIRDPKIHIKVLQDIIFFFIQNRLKIEGITYSPIKGPKGNIEFFLHALKENNTQPEYPNKNERVEDLVNKVVLEAHSEL